jgi:hypothetical protein
VISLSGDCHTILGSQRQFLPVIARSAGLPSTAQAESDAAIPLQVFSDYPIIRLFFTEGDCFAIHAWQRQSLK